MTKSEQLSDLYTDDLARAVHLAKLKGASSWLTVLPISDHDFALHKSAFRDALALQYGWLPARLPLKCICGEDFTVDHAMNCPHGGLPSLRHNELRDFTSSLLSEICSDVSIEPELQTLTGESMNLKTANVTDEARLDVKARGFWGSTSTKDIVKFNHFSQHEQVKRSYDQRIREVEHGTFTPLVFSSTGGVGKTANIFYRRLASHLSVKWDELHSIVLGWLRCHISFSLIRSAITCLRSSRSSSGHSPLNIYLVMRKTRFKLTNNEF